MSAKSIALFSNYRASQGKAPAPKTIDIRGTQDKRSERAAVAKAYLDAQKAGGK